MKNLYLIIFVLSVFFLSCQHQRITDFKLLTDAQIEKARNYVSGEIKKTGGLVSTVEIDKRIPTSYVDLEGNHISQRRSTVTRALSSCDDDGPDYLDLLSYSRYYTCGVGYQIQFYWQISWNNEIVVTSPYNSNNKTKGTVKISIPGNSNFYSNTTYDVEIFDMGADPDNSANNIYFIKMTTSDLVPVESVNYPGAVLRLGAYFATDCPTMESTQISPIDPGGLGFEGALNSDPCTRNDKVWFFPPGAASNNQFGVFGYDPLGTCPFYEAGAAPTFQEVSYSIDGGGWNDFINMSYLPSPEANNNFIRGSKYITRIDFALSNPLPAGTYNVTIRYANVKTNQDYEEGEIPTSFTSCMNASWQNKVYTHETYNGVIVP